jgi:hypothetical protein
MDDDLHKPQLLARILERAERKHGIRVEEREPIRLAWAEGLGLSRTVRREVKEVADSLVVPPAGCHTHMLCWCWQPADFGEVPARVERPIVGLAYELWAYRHRRWDTWIGQCPDCRTVYWRIQRA